MIVKPIYIGVGLLVLLLGRKRGNLDLDAQSLKQQTSWTGRCATVEVDLHDLDLNLVAHVGDLRRLVDVLVGHLGDVHQALDASPRSTKAPNGTSLVTVPSTIAPTRGTS